MSGFKRKQSKVFWGYMESQDFGAVQFPIQVDQPRSLPNLCDVEPIAEDCSSDLSKNESGASMARARSFGSIGGCEWDNEGATVRRASPERNGRSLRMRSAGLELEMEEQGIMERGRRSPCSQKETNDDRLGLSIKSPSHSIGSLRSQDSGFSDSERSESPESPREVARRRKNKCRTGRSGRQRRRGQRDNSLWTDEAGRPPSPAYTSTPKQNMSSLKIPRVPANRGHGTGSRRKPAKLLARFDREEDSRAATVSMGSPSSSSAGECLGDFLYASEPPEDPPGPISPCSARHSYALTMNISERQSAVRSESSSASWTSSQICDQLVAVRAWLRDLAVETEAECCATLQSKALPRTQQLMTNPQSQARDLNLLTASATAAATKLLVRADQFERHYARVLDEVTKLEPGKSERSIMRSIEEDAFSLLSELGMPPPRRIQQRNLNSLRGILGQLDNLKSEVNRSIDTRLDFYIERVVRGLEEAPREGGSAARGALAGLTALGLAGPRAGSSIARCSGVRALLTSVLSTGKLSSSLRAASLRALASVCCCPLAVERLVNEGGPEILTDLLSSDSFPETEKMEAAALVVQITAPWMDRLGLPHLETFGDSLVRSLTQLAENTVCSQTLLLAAAALNHLSVSQKCVEPMIRCETVGKLLRGVKKSAGGNVWLMEQVAALVGELSKSPGARQHLADAKASVALVCFLRMRPPGLEDAYRRLEMTATAALARLCVDPEVARQVVAVGGTDCLPCVRPGSPTTNMSSMAAARRSQKSGLLHYTRSLRVACRRAAKQIDVARANDYNAPG